MTRAARRHATIVLITCLLTACSSIGGDSADRLLLERAREQRAEAERVWAATTPVRSSATEVDGRHVGERNARPDGRPARAIRINRTLLYAPQWLRSDDLEQTLAPLVQNLYGPGAQVISQSSSNRIGIYIPPREARETGGAATGVGRPARGVTPRNSVRR